MKDPTLLFIAGCIVLCFAVIGVVAIVSGAFVDKAQRGAAFRARCATEGGVVITSLSSRGEVSYVCQPPGTTCNVVFRQEGRYAPE